MQIDWLTVAAQIVNFLVLVWLLQRFLYRPITAAMARREQRIQTRLAEAEDARGQVEAEATRLREQQQALADRRDEMLNEARQEAAALRADLEEEIRTEMEGRRAAWAAHLEDERAALADRLRHRAGHQVIDIVGRVLRDFAGADLAAQVAGTFADRLAGLTPEARDKLVAAAGQANGAARLESGLPLTPGLRDRITRTIRDHIAPDIEVEFSENGDVLLGMRLSIGEQTVEWSAARFLSRLETTFDEVIESGRPRTGHVAATG